MSRMGLPVFPLGARVIAVLLMLCVPITMAGVVPVVSKGITLTPADRTQIQRVITLQLKAFERNDDAVAFSFSTPGIRRQFGSARDFMEMVRADYTVLYDNVSRKFLEAAVVDGKVIQPLQVVSRGGEVLVALYILERQPDQQWRIAGCELASSTLRSA